MRNRNWLSIVSVLALAFVLGASTGCSSEPKDPFEKWDAGMKYDNYVPLTAQSVKSGSGVLEYTSTEAGMLYLLDTSVMEQVAGFAKPKVLITGLVPANTHVIFDPAAKRIKVKGREGVKLTEVNETHTHELRFDPSVKPAKPK